MKSKNNLLKNALRLNALFSSSCAILLLLYSNSIANLMGPFAHEILISIAIVLLLFVVVILSISEKKQLDSKQAKLITLMDISWVLGSFILLLFGFNWFTNLGLIIIVSVAFVVGLLAYLQFRSLRKL